MRVAVLARAISTIRLPTRWILGRRTMRMPDLRHMRVVRSLRGLIQPRRPVRTRMAGSTVTADSNDTRIATEIAGPTAENTSSLVKTIARNVIATVAADAAITLPMDINAFLTATSEVSPCRT